MNIATETRVFSLPLFLKYKNRCLFIIIIIANFETSSICIDCFPYVELSAFFLHGYFIVFYSLSLLRLLSKHLAKWETKPWKSLKYKLLHALLILVMSDSFSKNLFRFALFLMTDQNCSIGFCSGEYGGRYISISPRIDILTYISWTVNRSIIYDKVVPFHIGIFVHFMKSSL